jgi:hypothetical protein
MRAGGVQKSFSKPPHDGYQTTQNFMLISKMQTYLTDKMRPKRVMGQKRSPKFYEVFFGQKKWFLVLKKNSFSFMTFPSHKTM